jgi:hypothetical protein
MLFVGSMTDNDRELDLIEHEVLTSADTLGLVIFCVENDSKTRLVNAEPCVDLRVE